MNKLCCSHVAHAALPSSRRFEVSSDACMCGSVERYQEDSAGEAEKAEKSTSAMRLLLTLNDKAVMLEASSHGIGSLA